jgi:molybdenum cofactor biosynthesis enzyme MoaA
MALRLTSDGKLQYCLLREDNLVDLLALLEQGLTKEEIDELIDGVLATYRNAVFYKAEELDKLKSIRN